MTPTEAIRIASRAVSAPIGRATSWTVVGPYYLDQINGEYTESRADSYWRARHTAREWRIDHALALMGIHNDNAEPYASGDWRTIVRRFARAIMGV